MSSNRIFSSLKCRKWTLWNTQETITKINFHNKNAYTRDRKWNSCISTLGILEYIEKEVLFADISNPNTGISKIIYLIKPVDEWSEIAMSARQNAEKEHSDTLMKLVNKLHFHH
jgi:hypothetical protein